MLSNERLSLCVKVDIVNIRRCGVLQVSHAIKVIDVCKCTSLKHYVGGKLTIRLHTAPCLLCRSGVSLTWSVVTMAVPIRSHCEELEKPKPEQHQ